MTFPFTEICPLLNNPFTDERLCSFNNSNRKGSKVLLSPTVTCRSLEGLRRLSPPLYSDRFLISIFYSTRRYRHLRETAIAWNRKTVINSLLVIGINLQIPGCKSNCHSLYFQNSGVVFINHVVICINHDLVCTNHVVVSERECLLSRPTIFPDAQRFLSIFFVLSRIEKCVKTN